MSTLHCNATVRNSTKLAPVGQIVDLPRGRAVVPNLHKQLASPYTTLPVRHHVLRCRSNGDLLGVTTDKKKISIDLEPQAEGEYCMPGEVLLDNESHEEFTILRVEVKDYPGLLRVCAWVLNGLQLTVQNARLTTENGIANNVFWITTDAGRKLDLDRAELVAERVADFVVYCTPNQHAVEAQEFQEGSIKLTNKEHEKYSVVSVVSEPGKKGFLLDIASAMSGLGMVIHEAIIQGCNDNAAPEADAASNHASESRLFRFWVTDRRGDKLDYARCTALIYTMGLLLGRSNAPLRPPGSSFTISETGSDAVL